MQSSFGFTCPEKVLDGSNQQVISITPDSSSTTAKLFLVEKGAIQASFKGMIGRNGLSSNKKEGDGNSPAGIFPLIFGFGHLNQIDNPNFPYTKVSKDSHCIDDVNHPQYNRILYHFKKPKNISSENLLEVGAPYELAIAVDYNSLAPDDKKSPIKGKGSCIFLHIWKLSKNGKSLPTAGCTSMSKENMRRIMKWIDTKKKPILIQYTEAEYRRLQSADCVPKIF